MSCLKFILIDILQKYFYYLKNFLNLDLKISLLRSVTASMVVLECSLTVSVMKKMYITEYSLLYVFCSLVLDA